MKVLMYCLSSVSGGAVSYLRNMVPLLAERFEESSENHSLQLLAHESQKDLFPSLPDSQCVWVGGIRPTGYGRIVWEYRNITRIARETKADILFITYQIGPHIKGLKQVLMLRNMEPFRFGGFRYSAKSRMRNQLLHWQSSRAIRGADRVIAVSGFVESLLTEEMGIPSERIHMIYHGRDGAFAPDGDPGQDRDCLKSIGVEGHFLLTCGSLLPYRRCEDVIGAFEHCADTLDPEVKLVIAGAGNDVRYSEKIQRAIFNSPYSDRIIVVGHVSKEAMIALYRWSLVCVIATEIEACPNIAIEAMSSGCTIIAADHRPLPEMFQGAALEYRSRDIEDLAVKLKSCLEDDTLRSINSKRALLRAEDFSWEKCAEETYKALVEWPSG